MKDTIEKNELFQSAHLTILISFSIFSVVLIAESLLMDWEKWPLVLIIIAVASSWIIHIRQNIPDKIRLWIYSVMMMCVFFFYGTHLTSTFDLAIVISVVMLLYTMTGIKPMIILCEVTYFLTMTYEITTMIVSGAEFDALIISRTLLHLAMIAMIGRIARLIIDKWLKVLGRSREEIVQLKDATDRLNDFLANVSHEIRTPINAVIGLSSVCADKEKDPELHADMLSVNEAGRRVADQISDILDYSEIDRGKLARNDEDYMLSSLLNDIVNEIRPGKPDNIELIIDVDPAIPSVMCTDMGKLKKIFRHLIINGLKYTREGGVYVRVSSKKESYGVNLCIEVTDTGIGMSAEEKERVYESFYQANSGRTRSSSGLGLGMAIVSGFVYSLGGFIKLESEYGVGTSVHVSIPMKVVDASGCMSVADRERLCLGAFLHFEKFARPEVRDYYNSMVRNIVNGLGVQMHRVDNVVNLNTLLGTVELTHLFVGEEEYEENTELMEKLARKMKVAVVANSSFRLPENSKVRIMEKPFYCFPVAAILNEDPDSDGNEAGKMRCDGVRALVVDDEPMNLTVARSIFGRYGMEVFTAASGQESIDMCREERYDIVFMDHMMPGMDGVEAMKRIRSDPRRTRNDMPIVALTANAVSTAKEMFLSEGFDGFVSKPVELVELERVLRKVLPASMIKFEKSEGTEKWEKELEFTEKPAESEAQKKAAVTEPRGEYDILHSLGIDTDVGIRYCMNDKEFYNTLLKQFVTESAEKRREIEKHYSACDLKKYEIFVHALKSTSKMIGCMSLSEGAKALEAAAKKEDRNYIREHHAEVMEQYERLIGGISDALGTAVPDIQADDAGNGGAIQDDEAIEFAPDDGQSDDGAAVEFAPDNNGSDVADDILEFSPQD